MNYDEQVEQVKLRIMAEEEGKMRARAEILLASVTRMLGIQGADQPKLAESIAKCQEQAAACLAEANAINARVPKREPVPEHTVDDVIQTLQEKCDPLLGGFTQKAELSHAIDLLGVNELREAAEILQGIAWPAGADAYAGACLRVLEGLIDK